MLVAAALCLATAWRSGALAGVDAQAAVIPPSSSDRAMRPLRIGLLPSAMPLDDGTRRYTEEGFEALLAQALANTLARPLELVPLPVEAQATALLGAQVDAVLSRPEADHRDTRLRWLDTRFESGLSVAMRSDTDIRTWQDLAGRTLCLSAADPRSLALAQSLDAHIRVLRAPGQALALVRSGDCDASLHAQAQLAALFDRKDWQKFSATLPPQDTTRLALAVSPAAPAMAAALQQALAALDRPAAWQDRTRQWATDVAFDAYLDQVGTDCH